MRSTSTTPTQKARAMPTSCGKILVTNSDVLLTKSPGTGFCTPLCSPGAVTQLSLKIEGGLE